MGRAPWLVVPLLVLSACGSAEQPVRSGTEEPAASPAPSETRSSEPTRSPTPDPDEQRGTVLAIDDSEFGRMLFDRRGQAIYLFEPESAGTPACYGECEKAWPPVLTTARPQASKGADPDLLGTVRRRDGSRQVTYGGWPLYFYAHEGPGEVLCHDVFLNGGLWLAVGPDGRPLPA